MKYLYTREELLDKYFLPPKFGLDLLAKQEDKLEFNDKQKRLLNIKQEDKKEHMCKQPMKIIFTKPIVIDKKECCKDKSTHKLFTCQTPDGEYCHVCKIMSELEIDPACLSLAKTPTPSPLDLIEELHPILSKDRLSCYNSKKEIVSKINEIINYLKGKK